MRRLLLAWAVVLALLLGAVPYGRAQDGAGGDSDEGMQSAARGAVVYATCCQACHGPQGEGAAESPAFPALTYDDPARVLQVLSEGAGLQEEGGIAMPAYDEILTETQVEDLTAYLAAWQEGSAPPLPEPQVQVHDAEAASAYAGDPHEGAVVYAVYCNGCHGVEGAGRGASAFPPLSFEGERTLQAVREGTDSPYMPAFGEAHGGPLTDSDLDHLAAYLATWEPRPEAEEEAQGLGILVLFVGLAAILGVGLTFGVRQSRRPPG